MGGVEKGKRRRKWGGREKGEEGKEGKWGGREEEGEEVDGPRCYLSYFPFHFRPVHVVNVCDDTGNECPDFTDRSHVTMQDMAVWRLGHFKFFLSLQQKAQTT